MKFVLVKKFEWEENGKTGIEKDQVIGFNYSNMGEFMMIRWELKEFKEKFPNEEISEIREKYYKRY